MKHVLEDEGNKTKPAAYVGFDFIHTKHESARNHLRKIHTLRILKSVDLPSGLKQVSKQ